MKIKFVMYSGLMFLLIVFGSASVSLAQIDRITGGYVAAEVVDKEVIQSN